MPLPALWDLDRPPQPRGRSPDVTARAFPHPFARRIGIAWNRWAKVELRNHHHRTLENHDALLVEIRAWVTTILDNLAIARQERQPQGGDRGTAPRPSMTNCATTLVHCMSGRGFLQNGPDKEDSINDMFNQLRT